MYSLEKKLTRRLTISMVVVMLALLVASYFSVRQIVQDYVVTRLQHDSESIISALEIDDGGNWTLANERMSSVYNRVRSGHYYQVAVGKQLLSSRSLFDATFPDGGEQAYGSNVFTVPGLGEEQWLVWSQQVTKQGSAIDIQVAEDIRPVQNRLIVYTVFAAILILLVGVLLLLVQRQILRHSFTVFDHLKDNLVSIRRGTDDFIDQEIPGEVLPLVNEIRQLVEQLRQRIERTRNAIGNLAHELKRPVQILSLKRDEGEAYLDEPLEEIERIIERELKRAKISGTRDAGGMFDLAADLPTIVEVMRNIYPDIQVELRELQVVDSINIDRDDVLELIGNLLENACKFANHQVLVDCIHKNNALVLRFEDDGPGLEQEQIAEVLSRGTRLDESIPGNGLGLGICRDIVEMYNGHMSFARSDTGGLRVEVTIPVGSGEIQGV